MVQILQAEICDCATCKGGESAKGPNGEITFGGWRCICPCHSKKSVQATAGKVVTWGYRHIGLCAAAEEFATRDDAVEALQMNPWLKDCELVRVTIEPWPKKGKHAKK